MSLLCPIANRTIDQNIVRIASFIIVLLSLSSLFIGIFIPATILLIDFGIRSFTSKASPTGWVARQINRVLKLPSNPINAGQKIFAARVGVAFVAMTIVLNIFSFVFVAKVVMLVLAFFALLEGVLALCVACYMYTFLLRFQK